MRMSSDSIVSLKTKQIIVLVKFSLAIAQMQKGNIFKYTVEVTSNELIV